MKTQNNNTKKLQEIEIEMLNDFVKICKKYNLKYFLAYGTLIGAIRHKGFIPWDDDIDVHMPLNDYLKFIKVAQKEFKDKYFLQNFTTEYEYNQLWSKMRKNGTLMVESAMENSKIHKGIFIDIFPLIPYPSDKKEEKKFRKQYFIFKIFLEKNMNLEWINKYYGFLGKIIWYMIKIVPKNISISIRNKYFDKITNFKGRYDFYISGAGARKFPKTPFLKSIYWNFENNKYLVPIGYDELLTYMYGNYMKIPQKKDQITHSPIILSFGDKDEN